MPTFDPYSPQAKAIVDIFIVTLGIGGVIFLLVTILVLVASFRFRDRNTTGLPRQIYGNRKLEIAWTAAPALILLVLFGLTLRTSQFVDPSVTQNQPDIVIIGHQWWWEIHYPKYNVVTANEVHMPAGARMAGIFESADVIHDFWVPQLGRKIDLIPGHPNTMYIQVNTPGVYLGTCAEFCGAEHAWMRIRVIAQTQDDFNAWIAQQQKIPPAPTTPDAINGAQLFESLPCRACHTIDGTQANGKVGPDLTHIASRQTIGAGVLQNNPGSLSIWVDDAQSVKPGIYMPVFDLSTTEIREIVAYLETLK